MLVVSESESHLFTSVKLLTADVWTLPLQDVEIDIELAPGDQTAIPKSKEQSERDTGNQLHMLTNRHDKFLDSLREVKVSLRTSQNHPEATNGSKRDVLLKFSDFLNRSSLWSSVPLILFLL